ncbi:MAG: hypothetical protein WD029_00700 [Microthrixaceae bacterium]
MSNLNPQEVARDTSGPEFESLGRTPGDLLLHPVALLSLGLVIFNDQVLKVYFPSSLSGKLSDFAGLIYFPLLLVAVVELLRKISRCRPWELGRKSVIFASLSIGAIFIAIKIWNPAADLYRVGLGYFVWPVSAAVALVQGRGLPELRPMGLIQDKTDLFALIVLPITIRVGTQVIRRKR